MSIYIKKNFHLKQILRQLHVALIEDNYPFMNQTIKHNPHLLEVDYSNTHKDYIKSCRESATHVAAYGMLYELVEKLFSNFNGCCRVDIRRVEIPYGISDEFNVEVWFYVSNDTQVISENFTIIEDTDYGAEYTTVFEGNIEHEHLWLCLCNNNIAISNPILKPIHIINDETECYFLQYMIKYILSYINDVEPLKSDLIAIAQKYLDDYFDKSYIYEFIIESKSNDALEQRVIELMQYMKINAHFAQPKTRHVAGVLFDEQDYNDGYLEMDILFYDHFGKLLSVAEKIPNDWFDSFYDDNPYASKSYTTFSFAENTISNSASYKYEFIENRKFTKSRDVETIICSSIKSYRELR